MSKDVCKNKGTQQLLFFCLTFCSNEFLIRGMSLDQDKIPKAEAKGMTPISGAGTGVEAVWECTEGLQPSRR